MYLQITTRCNMLCAHCCFACTREGSDMTRDTFVKGLVLAQSSGDDITIGGGEPTLHPLFWDFVGLALHHCGYGGLFVATNGTDEKSTESLARLCEREVLGARISRDRYHLENDGAKCALSDASLKSLSKHSSIHIADYLDWKRVIPIGRGMLYGQAEYCVCDTVFVEPSGQMWECGCRLRSYGTVDKPKRAFRGYERQCTSATILGEKRD